MYHPQHGLGMRTRAERLHTYIHTYVDTCSGRLQRLANRLVNKAVLNSQGHMAVGTWLARLAQHAKRVARAVEAQMQVLGAR